MPDTVTHPLSFLKAIAALATVAALCGPAIAAAPLDVPFTADRWTVKGDVKFQKIEGFPHGLMESKGSAVLHGATFKNGAIDVDVMFGGGISTIIFRRGEDVGEALVLRPQANCPASNDCIQYTPVLHGAFLWDLYPQYQTKAPLSDKLWNHLRIVAVGRTMRVYMNGLSQPVLAIDALRGVSSEGGLRLSGNASWANLVITPDVTGDPPTTINADPAASDQNLLRAWQLHAPTPVMTTLDKKLDAKLGALPSVDVAASQPSTGRPVIAEPDGLVNLSREVGSSKGEDVRGAWLTTTVQSDRDQLKHVHIGWVREIAVFANGKPVFQDRNLYGVAGAQKEPDGRLGLSNGQFDLPLHKGANTVRVFIDDNFGGPQHFGWGFKMRLDDTSGVHLQR